MVIPMIISVLLAFVWIDAWIRYSQAKDQFRARRQAPGETAIGPWWVWQEGEAQPLLRYPNSQLGVRLSTNPPRRIQFAIEERSPFSHYNVPRHIAVLIPQGHEAEAAALVARFQREIINTPAAIHPPRQVPTPPPLLAPTPAITQRLPPLPALPTDADTQRLTP